MNAVVEKLTLDGFTVNDTTVTIGASDVVAIADVTGAAADFHLAAAATVPQRHLTLRTLAHPARPPMLKLQCKVQA